MAKIPKKRKLAEKYVRDQIKKIVEELLRLDRLFGKRRRPDIIKKKWDRLAKQLAQWLKLRSKF